MTHVYVPSNDSVLKVATVADLPSVAPDGQLAITLDTDTLYAFDGTTSTWVVIGGAGVINSVTDTDSVDLTITGTALSAAVRLSSDAADAGYTIIPIDIRTGASKGLRAQVQNSAIQGLISVTDTNSVDLTYAAGALSSDVRLSTNAADAGYTKIALDIQAAVSLGLRAQVQNTTIYGLFSGTAPIAFSNTTGVISISQSGVATDGYLSSTDWNTFNNKVSSTRTISTTTPLQGGGDLSANRTLSILQSGAAQDGYLSSIDWNTLTATTTASVGTDLTLVMPGTGMGTALVRDGLGVVVELTSSRSFKENIKDLTKSHDVKKIIANLVGRQYNYKTEPNIESFGFIAEEVESICKEVVIYKDGKPHSLNYNAFIPIITEYLKSSKKDYDQFVSLITNSNKEIIAKYKELETRLHSSPPIKQEDQKSLKVNTEDIRVKYALFIGIISVIVSLFSIFLR